MLTVDFARLGLAAGRPRPRHGLRRRPARLRVYRRGADVVAFDQDAEELSEVAELFAAMREAGEVPDGAEADAKQGDALSLPFPDGEFDRVVASEVLEHIPDDEAAIAELVRVLRPGGTIAVTVPRWLPEKICWALCDAVPRGRGRPRPHLHRRRAASASSSEAGLVLDGTDHAHGLHSPYWWLKCAVGVDNDKNPLGEGVPPAAGLGHHEDAALEHAHPARRAGAQPADRQELGALPAQAGMSRPTP